MAIAVTPTTQNRSADTDEDGRSGDGNDIYGLHGRDQLSGGYGNDRIHGGYDDDVLYGDAGNDQLYGELAMTGSLAALVTPD